MNTTANAAAFVDLGNPATKIVFHTLSGPLAVSRRPVEDGALVETPSSLVMSLPLVEPKDPLPAACSNLESPLIKALCPGLQARLHLLTLLGPLNPVLNIAHMCITRAHGACTCHAIIVHAC